MGRGLPQASWGDEREEAGGWGPGGGELPKHHGVGQDGEVRMAEEAWY